MAILTVSGTVHRLEGLDGVPVMVELLNPCVSGHAVAAVTMAGADGRFEFAPVDTDSFGCDLVRQPAMFVRATAPTKDGLRTYLGEGKCIGDCCSCGGNVKIDAMLPSGLDLLVNSGIPASAQGETPGAEFDSALLATDPELLSAYWRLSGFTSTWAIAQYNVLGDFLLAEGLS